jgi:UDP-N-acetylmuramate--alanine ligase
VVVTAAVDEKNPEVAAARRRALPIVKYATLLGELMRDRFGIAVAGCHGKSTTSAMTAYVLDRGGYEPSFVVGGGIPDLGGSSRGGKGEPFVAEACEHFRSFHNLYPHIAVVTNIEEDHLDYYRDIDEIIGSFGVFLSHVPPEGLVVINGEDGNCARAMKSARCRVETFGFGPGMDWRAINVRVEDGRWKFDALRHEALFGSFELAIPGEHNARVYGVTSFIDSNEGYWELGYAYLEDRSRSLDDVATALGFASANAFIRAYKRWTGLTPARART